MKVLASAIGMGGGNALREYYADLQKGNSSLYNTHLYAENEKSTLKVPAVPAVYEEDVVVNGFEVLNKYFDALFNTIQT